MIKGLNETNIELEALLFVHLISLLSSNIPFQSVSMMDENSTFCSLPCTG